MPNIETGPRVVVSVTATGGGDWQVVSTPTGFNGITSALFADNDYIHGFCRFENGVDWEEYDTDSDSVTGLLQIANVSGTVTITRPAVPYASSNGGARVAVVTGTHTLAISLGSGTMRRIIREVNGTWKTFTSGDATPTVADFRLFKTAGSTTITAFDNMEDGKLFVVQRGASDITIADGAGISLPGNQNLTLTASLPGAIFVEDGGVAILVSTVGPMDWDQVPNTIAATELTIASGAITPVYATHTVDTEADAASDDLATITGTNFKAGDSLTISAANGSRDVVIKASGGNILLPNDLDITLDDAEKTVILRFDGTNWNYVAGGNAVSPVIQNAVVSTTLTLATGAVTPTRASHLVDTESAAASDDLDTVTATNFKAGDVLTLAAANGARTVVVKHGTGNITHPSSVDVTLDDAVKTCQLRYDGTNWNVMAGAEAVTATGSTTSRTLADRFAEVTNVKDFGAVGDGATDDTTAVQAAFTYAASNGKRLYFPLGTYLVTTTIGTISTSDWTIYGEDASGTILQCSGDTDAIKIDVSAAYYYRVTIRDIEILNSHATGLNSTGIRVVATTGSVTGLRQSLFQNIRFRGVGYGIFYEDTGKVSDGGGFTSVGAHGFNSHINLEFPQYTRYPLGGVHFEGANGPHHLFLGGQYRADATSGFGIYAGSGANSVTVGDMIINGIHFVIGSAAVKLVGPGDGAYKASCSIIGCQFDVMTNYAYHIENLDRLRILGNNTLVGVDANIVNCDLTRSVVETRDEIYQYGLLVNHLSTAVDRVTITGGDSSSTNATIAIDGTSTDSSLSIRGKGAGKVFLAQHRANYASVTGSDSSGGVVTAEALGSDTDIDYRIHGKGAGGVRLSSQLANYLQCDGAAASSYPGVAADGSDTNIHLLLSGKGTGEIRLAAQRTNYILAQGHNTGNAPTIKPDGGDTNIGLNLFAKGSGTVMLGFTGQTVGFFGGTGTTKATVTGSRGANAALASLLTALSGYGLLTDSSS